MNSTKNRKGSSFIKRNGVFLLVFLIGLSILLYPQVSRFYYTIESNKQVSQFETSRKVLNQEDIDKRISLAKAFNETLHNVTLEDPYSEAERRLGKAEYAHMLEVKEKIGHVEIPSIDSDLPIYAGTSEETISKGVGHLEGTSLPVGGANTHTVLTSHAGLPSAKLFTDLSKVKEGDVFYIHNIKEVLAYQVDRIEKIEPTDFSNLVVIPGGDFATLLTCTPIGINTHRLIVRGHRIPYEDAKAKPQKKETNLWWVWILLLILLLVLLLIWFVRRRKKCRKDGKKTAKKEA